VSSFDAYLDARVRVGTLIAPTRGLFAVRRAA
jgi:hypothetical protein